MGKALARNVTYEKGKATLTLCEGLSIQLTNLVHVHLKVKRNWDTSGVSPIPAKSLAKGTLDIFRRLFQVPEKLVTGTGDVLLGRQKHFGSPEHFAVGDLT